MVLQVMVCQMRSGRQPDRDSMAPYAQVSGAKVTWTSRR